MLAKGLTPILNVSDIVQSFAWFEKLGWRKGWDWGSDLATTAGVGEAGDKGVWMSIWVDDVDVVHRHCLEQGIEVTHPPTDEPWHVREMHVRHPDGHVFRISRGIGDSK
jgi:hypothetical protein